MWSGALISALLGTQFPGPGTIYQDQALHFVKPVRVGDTLTVTVTVTSRDPATNSIELDCQVVNQNRNCVLSGTARVLAPTIKVRLPRVVAPRIQVSDPQARFNELLSLSDELDPVRCAVVHPCDDGSLSGAMDAARYGLIIPVLIGPETRIRHVAAEAGIDLTGAEIIPEPHSHAAAERAAELAASGNVEMLMKGSLHTDELITAVLSKSVLRTGRRMSHVFRFDVPLYHKPLLITDAALNIHPNLSEKVDIIQNAIDFARVMGVATPKVAILSAVETVNPNIPSTLDAAAMCKMADRGQITGGILDGPLAFDNAISMHAAQIKHIKSEVAGHADILAVPDLESGNMLAKQLEYLAGASGSGIVLGARLPIALTSRAEGPSNRVASALLCLMVAHNARRSQPRAVW
jgi:phosphate acetyltransferase